MFGKNDIKVKDTITKQDLVDYAVTTKVVEITKQRDDVYEKYKLKSKEREDIKKEINVAVSESELQHVKENYGDVIKLLEMKQGGEHFIFSRNQDIKSVDNNIKHIIREATYTSDDIFIVIPNIKNIKNNRVDYHFQPYMDIMSSIVTMITISRGDINSDVVDELRKKLEFLDSECKRLDKKKSSFDSMIIKVKNQKDVIKANIIEHALKGSSDGKKMLESLQNIDFGIDQTKFISAKKPNEK